MYLWGSHLEGLEEFTHEFNKSIDFDKILFQEDITGSLAHVEMLCKKGIIDQEDFEIISKELKNILEEIKNNELEIDLREEDIHSFIENELTKRVGSVGKKLHTARSRNDQCALDLRLYSKKVLAEINNDLRNLIVTIISLAEENKNTIMPGFTHMQHAQVTSFAHYILSYAQMFKRDCQRLKSSLMRLDENPLGSCALATTSFDIDRFMTSEILGFKKPTENSMDSVSDRDYVLEILFNNSLIMTHLSRLCEELIYFSSSEYDYIKFSGKFSTGSSIMPQKKNPDMAELIRGKSGRAFGDLITVFTVLKGTPLAYNKDFQEDKEALFDSVKTTASSLKIMKGIIESLELNKDKMRESAEKGFLNATDLADYLVLKGLAFREAYDLVGQIVNFAIEENLKLEEISLEKYKSFNKVFDKDLYDFIEIENSLNNRKLYGGPAEEAVIIQIENLKKSLNI
ncbi:MAG: argininosuccinate lyase [Peptoniphilus harei]|nr:argininosuccinate lyase [Peptoniphilus harei]